MLQYDVSRTFYMNFRTESDMAFDIYVYTNLYDLCSPFKKNPRWNSLFGFGKIADDTKPNSVVPWIPISERFFGKSRER